MPSKLEQKVFHYIEEHGMIRENDRVIAGVSGGADSLCLLFLLCRYRKRIDFSIEAVHVEHGIRGAESLADADFVEECCKKWGIRLHVRHLNIPKIAKREKLSEEEAGRKLRYEIFAEIAGQSGKTKIAVAHHRDDQAETLLANIARGTGLSGAGGMRPVNGSIIRPLLCCRRMEIEEYLLSRQMEWRQDATNEETDYTRNYLRNCILPRMTQRVNAQTIEHMASLAEDLQRVQDFIRHQAKQILDTTLVQREEGFGIGGGERITAGRENRELILNIPKLRQQEQILQETIIQLCLERVGCGRKDITRRHIRGILDLTLGQSGRRIMLPGGWRAKREFDRICIEQGCREMERKQLPKEECKEPSAHRQLQQTDVLLSVPGETTLPQKRGSLRLRRFENPHEIISPKMYTKWLNYDKISNDLHLRTRRAGDYLVINREGGRKKLKDYFVEEKIPRELRDDILVIAQGSEILWVIGGRINEAYKVEEGTKEILEIQIMEEVKWETISES
ncbi:MAG: tRNA lysidine(34) synthetase TilS [Eubacteriales bacterium]|nr:tRNA lysidine(34) synthetase TilS [Eubacteriales bacterium]